MKTKKVKTEIPDDVDQCDVKTEQAIDLVEGESVKKSEIRVLSKNQWKKLRNNYLNEQRKNFASLKRALRNRATPYGREKGDDGTKVDDVKAAANIDDCKSGVKASTTVKDEKVEVKASTTVKDEKVEIKAGCIVRVCVPGGVDNLQKLKQKVREGLGGEAVAYVDGKIGVETVFVRCVDKAQADRLSGVEVGEGWKGEVITGKEEEEYHAKIDRDKKDKRSGKVVVKKTKTKTKLLQKA